MISATKKSDKIVSLATLTKLSAEHRGSVIVSGSHGGLYPAYLAAKGGVRAVVLNDAGVGKDQAGIAVIEYCQRLGIAAATVSHESARIGDADDMLARGSISFVNNSAASLGCKVGNSCWECAALLTSASITNFVPQAYAETRRVLRAEPGCPMVIALDSASLVLPEDRGAIVITGSHGGLLGGKLETALQVDALAAFFNDAGIGIEEAGVRRLPVLEGRGIAAVTVAAESARIGDARSTFADGKISCANSVASGYGAVIGMPVSEFVENVISSFRAGAR